MSPVTIQPDTGDFRLLDRRCVLALRRLREANRNTKALFSWIGFRKKEILYDRDARLAGRSKWSYPKLVRLAIDGITSFSTAPLRVASYMGGIVSVLALVRVVADLRHMILALPVLVLGPLALRYGYEIRMYALLMLLAALGTLLLFHATRAEDALARGRSDATARRRVWVWWVLYAVVVCLGMLTQYLIAFLWAVQAVWLLARTLHTHPARGDASSWRWLAAYALAVLLYLP